MSSRDTIALIILIYLHTNSVYFVLACPQANVKSEIFVELTIGFGGEGSHPR